MEIPLLMFVIAGCVGYYLYVHPVYREDRLRMRWDDCETGSCNCATWVRGLYGTNCYGDKRP